MRCSRGYKAMSGTEQPMKKESALYLVVTPFFPSPDSWRGAYCYDFVQALRRIGRYDVRVFVPGAGSDYDYQGVHVCRFPVRALPSGLLPFLFARQNIQSFLRKLEAEGIALSDVAVCHGHTAHFGVYLLALKRLNPHCLTLLHHHDPASFGLRSGRLGKVWLSRLLSYFSLRRIHEAMDCHVFISRSVERSFRMAPKTDWTVYRDYRRMACGVGWLKPVRVRNAILLHNGVDAHRFTAEQRANRGKTVPFAVGCIANFVDWKDQLSLLRAVASLRDRLGDWRLRLIGSGPTLAACKAYVTGQSLQDRVSFESEVDHTELPDFYRSLDLFVLPSYFEGFGCVFTEAWACGTPFITCGGQGMDDLVLPEERHLWLCKPMNPEDLAEKILYFYEHRPEQHLAGPVDIDLLVPRFVRDVERLREVVNG